MKSWKMEKDRHQPMAVKNVTREAPLRKQGGVEMHHQL
jgi:hypothetical protein